MKYLMSLVTVCLVALYANACPIGGHVVCPSYVQPSVILAPQYTQPQILVAPTPQVQLVPNVQYESQGVCPSFTPNVGYGGVLNSNAFAFHSNYGGLGFNTFGVHNTFARERVIVRNHFSTRGAFLANGVGHGAFLGNRLGRAAVDVRIGRGGFFGRGNGNRGVRVRLR